MAFAPLPGTVLLDLFEGQSPGVGVQSFVSGAGRVWFELAVTPPAEVLSPAATAVPLSNERARAERRSGRLAERTRHRHALVHQLLAQGRDLRAVARELNLARTTVRRFARASSPEELLVHNGTGKRPTMIEEFSTYLRHRWEHGCTNAEQLYQEIKARGYRGTGRSVREYVRPWRSQTTIALPPPSPPTVRQATGWFLRHPDTLEADERHHLQALTAGCPALAALHEHVRAFAHMMPQLTGDGLERWMTAVQASDLPELHSFVTGLRRDFDAAKAGLTLPYSSGKVEGHVNRVKMLKRQMYGRANPDPLRKRMLLADRQGSTPRKQCQSQQTHPPVPAGAARDPQGASQDPDDGAAEGRGALGGSRSRVHHPVRRADRAHRGLEGLEDNP
jgi:hypothetical protein